MDIASLRSVVAASNVTLGAAWELKYIQRLKKRFWECVNFYGDTRDFLHLRPRRNPLNQVAFRLHRRSTPQPSELSDETSPNNVPKINVGTPQHADTTIRPLSRTWVKAFLRHFEGLDEKLFGPIRAEFLRIYKDMTRFAAS